jgi:tetratricopeptide (TPR) repeat protein
MHRNAQDKIQVGKVRPIFSHVRSRKSAFSVLILLIASSFSVAQSPGKLPGKVERVSLDDLRSQGSEALYNLDYEGARRRFQEMLLLFPEHPAGPQSMATSLWLEELNRSRRLHATLYSAESQQKGTAEVPDAATVREFREWIRKAKQLSQALLHKDPRDVEALYFLGATAGLDAVFAASIERRFFAASRLASSAVDRHREVLKLDPQFHDASLSIGLYSYVLGSLPLPIRMLASIGGMRGSKKRGLEMLERVAREGRWARDVARVVLIDLYKREKRWSDALTLSRDLGSRYPRNYGFQLQTADTLVRRSAEQEKAKGGAAPQVLSPDEREAFGIFDGLINEKDRFPLDVIHFRYGETLLIAKQSEKAAREFLSAARLADSDALLKSTARLRAAQSMDLAGKRQDALAEYRAILKGPNVGSVHEQARRGLREAYRDSK